ncbi:MAG: 3D domain-containing protein [Deltaproteobacteria bacterium]|nr:3D domain-containing protein [Deltaproteobacteria bacterium]
MEATRAFWGGLLCSVLLAGCTERTPVPGPAEPIAPPRTSTERSVRVTATAFNSLAAQTDSTPGTTASGAKLRPGMQVIAVSKDLAEMGLDEGTKVRIEGLPGGGGVADKMDARWHRRIDVYFGKDESAALEFGKKEVTIHWTAAPGAEPRDDSARPPR